MFFWGGGSKMPQKMRFTTGKCSPEICTEGGYIRAEGTYIRSGGTYIRAG